MTQRTALVIDPDNELVDELSKILRPPEWIIQTAPENDAALGLVKKARFDLIITSDKSSAKEDLDLLRKIRRAHPHTRVIILTDDSTPADVLDAMREGAFSYFSRPFSVSALGEMVLRAVEGPCWDDGIEILMAKPEWVRLAARCDMKTADRLLQFIDEVIDLPEAEKSIVASALRELLMNAIEYGGRFDPEKYVELSYLRTKRSVACRIKDPGVGFSLNEIRHSAIMNPPEDPLRHVNYREAENKRPGGFGVLLAQNSVDELIYSDKGNEVLMIKYVDQRHPAVN
jgi:DNA-binding NarL/FixJ family response regulator